MPALLFLHRSNNTQIIDNHSTNENTPQTFVPLKVLVNHLTTNHVKFQFR